MKNIAKVFLGLLYSIFSVWLFVPLVKMYYTMNPYMDQEANPNIQEYLELYLKPLESYKLLSDANIFKGWALITIVFGILFIIFIIILKESNRNINGVLYAGEDKTFGSSEWLEDYKKIKDILNIKSISSSSKGIILGNKFNKVLSLPANISRPKFNRNIAIFGAPGSMKSRAFARNNILEIAALGESLVITDPKAELYLDCKPVLEMMGYEVKSLNLVNMIYSDRWNMLAEVTDDLSAQTFAEVVIENTEEPSTKKGGDKFWDRSEKNLLKALALYVVTSNTIPKEEKNMRTLYAMIASPDPLRMDKLFGQLSETHPAKQPYNLFAQSTDKVKASIITGLGTRLQVFQNAIVQSLTETSDIDLTAPAKRKCAYFCIISDMESTFNFISGLFFSFMFIKIMKYADHRGGKCKVPVNMMLDEFPNISSIPDFTKKIATMRSRLVNVFVIFQNISQLQNRYPNNGWSEILGCCDTKLFLGCTDLETAEYVSKVIGKTTVITYSNSRDAGFNSFLDYGKLTEKTNERQLITPDELQRLDIKKAIVMIKGQNPIIVEKMDYTKHRLGKYIDKYKLKDMSQDLKEWSEKYKDLINENDTIDINKLYGIEENEESEINFDYEEEINSESEEENNKNKDSSFEAKEDDTIPKNLQGFF